MMNDDFIQNMEEEIEGLEDSQGADYVFGLFEYITEVISQISEQAGRIGVRKPSGRVTAQKKKYENQNLYGEDGWTSIVKPGSDPARMDDVSAALELLQMMPSQQLLKSTNGLIGLLMNYPDQAKSCVTWFFATLGQWNQTFYTFLQPRLLNEFTEAMVDGMGTLTADDNDDLTAMILGILTQLLEFMNAEFGQIRDVPDFAAFVGLDEDDIHDFISSMAEDSFLELNLFYDPSCQDSMRVELSGSCRLDPGLQNRLLNMANEMKGLCILNKTMAEGEPVFMMEVLPDDPEMPVDPDDADPNLIVFTPCTDEALHAARQIADLTHALPEDEKFWSYVESGQPEPETVH